MRFLPSHVVQKIKGRTSTLTLLTLAVVFFSIPLTLVVLQAEQDTRQEASEAEIQQIRMDAFFPDEKNPTGSDRETIVPGKIVIKYVTAVRNNPQSASATDRRLEQKFDGTITPFERLSVRELTIDPGNEEQVINELKNDPDVEGVRNLYYVYGTAEANDELFDRQWGMSKIQAPDAWGITEGSNNVVVAVLDSGIEENHPDLKGKIVSGSKVFHATATNTKDNAGHGTHVAGIIAANTDNNIGVAGVCPNCKVMNVKVLEGDSPESTSGDDLRLAEAVMYAADQNVDVINISIGSDQHTAELEDALAYAFQKGIVNVASAGNDGSSAKKYPAANSDYVIAVGGTDDDDGKGWYSNFGSWVHVAAPGTAIWSTFKGGQYAELTGTSQAAPHVSGIAGLLASKGMSASQIKRTIEQTSDKTSGNSWVNGRVNAAKALGADVSDPGNNDDPDTDDPSTDRPRNDKPADNNTPDPCITPGFENPDIPDLGNPPVQNPRSDRDARTPGGNDIFSRVGRGIGSLWERVMRNAQELRDRFFGGGRNNARNGNARTQSVSIQAKDPCDSSNRTSIRRSNRDGREFESSEDGRTRRNARSARPTKAKDRSSDRRSNRSGEPGRAVTIVEPGETRVVTIVERTCEPATVKTPGGTTIIPCDGETSTQSVSVIDYNDIIACFGENPTSSCTEEKKHQADLDNDGDVDQVDYNLFLSSFSSQ